jgi:putative tryptophan/tyrosine transport system substrate-binding protein
MKMQRRELIAGLVTIAAAPVFGLRLASAQQAEKMRRVGVLMGLSESNPAFPRLVDAFVQELARLGWVDGHNARIEQRWTNADVKRASSLATELVALQPDVIVCSTTPAAAALHRETSTVPIVFTIVSDPVGAGFVAGLPRPGSNMTGFINTEAGVAGKWLSLLKEIAPGIKRAGIMFNPDTAPGGGQYYLDSFEAAARSLAVEPVVIGVRSDAEIDKAIAGLGSATGLVLMDDSFMGVHYRTVISSTVLKAPTIFLTPEFVKDGGLLSYGPDLADIFRRAAGYVDRILRGEKPADLPVQTPTKYETAINLKTAKALGLTVPPTLLATADEVIE